MKVNLFCHIRTTLLAFLVLPVFANAQNSVNAFSSTGSMSVARNQTAATLLPTGKVLVSGGSDLITFKSSAELFDTATGTFSPTGSMASFRVGHSSTLLLNGRVLVSGGENDSAPKAAELYDPSTGVFTPTGIPLGARTNCPATLLQNGNVLFVGGLTGPGPLVEIYDSLTGQFASIDTGSAAIPQASHSAALLKDGRVLVTGGFGGPTFTQLATAFLYDPVSNVFSQTGPLSTPRVGHASLLLGNGRVLIVGGSSGNGVALNAELYDPQSGSFSLTGLPSVIRLTPTATLLPDGAVLVAGGGVGAEVYDPTSGTFSPIISMITDRITHAASLLPDGRVLIVGGLDFANRPLASAEIFQRLSPQAPAVLIVPGILGTKLAHCTDPSCQTEDRTVWITDIAINAALSSFLQFNPISELSYDLSGHEIAPLTPFGSFGDLLNLNPNAGNFNGLTCGGVPLAILGGIGSCKRNVNTYNDLVTSLRTDGYSVHTFPYDWRRHIGDLADDLSANIIGIAQQENRPVAIVAHSLGGLILGEALRRHGTSIESSLGPIVTLGAPFSGSVSTYMYFQAWDSIAPFLSPSTTQAVGSNWTAAYELLPQFNFLFDVNGNQLSSRKVYQGDFAPFPALPRAADALPLAFNLWDETAAFTQQYPSAYAFIGAGRATTTAIRPQNCTQLAIAASVQKRQIEIGDGDGTVPLSSAEAATWIPQTNFRYVVEDHLLLPSNRSVLIAIEDVLQGKQPNNLSLDAAPISPSWAIQACSPVDLTVLSPTGEAVGPGFDQIDGARQFRVDGHPEIVVPVDSASKLQIRGNGHGSFSVFVSQVDGQLSEKAFASFINIPVLPQSKGEVPLDNSIGSLLYDFDGTGQFDIVPANVIPPTVQCIGCAIGEDHHSSGNTTFNIGYSGRMSTFSLQSVKGDDGRAIHFTSSRVNIISVGMASAHFEGVGSLNGQPGFLFSVDVGHLYDADDHDARNRIVLTVTNGARKMEKIKFDILNGNVVIKPGGSL